MVPSVWLPQENLRRLDALVVRTGQPRSFHVRDATERGLPQVEWEYGIAERARDVRAGTIRTKALGELAAGLGLEK